MTVTITEFRKDLFKLAATALQGELVEFTWQGVVFRVVPETRNLKTSNLVGQPTFAPDFNPATASQELAAEMERVGERLVRTLIAYLDTKSFSGCVKAESTT